MTVAFKYATFVIVIAIFVSIIYVKDKVKDKPLEDISYELNV